MAKAAQKPAAKAVKPTAPKAAKPESAESGKTVIRPKVDNYVAGVSGSGKVTKNNGDIVAQALNGLTIENVVSLAEDVCGEDHSGKYRHLNVGQQRMNLGNRIRGAVAALNKANAGSGDAKLAKSAKTFDKLRAQPKPKAEKKAA